MLNASQDAIRLEMTIYYTASRTCLRNGLVQCGSRLSGCSFHVSQEKIKPFVVLTVSGVQGLKNFCFIDCGGGCLTLNILKTIVYSK